MIAKSFAARFGPLGYTILARWKLIVGPQLAARTVPLRLVRTPDGAATLRIRVDGAAALAVQHQAPQIVERINLYFGAGTVRRLAIEQGPVPRPPAPPQDAPPRPLAPEETARLEALVARIADPQLKAALVALGTRILLRRSEPHRFD